MTFTITTSTSYQVVELYQSLDVPVVLWPELRCTTGKDWRDAITVFDQQPQSRLKADFVLCRASLLRKTEQ